MARAKKVSLKDILTEGEALRTQVRQMTDGDVVKRYATALRQREKFPPVTLIEAAKGRYYIADGWHRVEAHKAARRAVIDAYVLPCAKGQSALDTATRYALGANTTHGLQLSPGDQGKKAALAILLPAMAPLTDRAIGKEIGVSHQTVSRARAEAVRERKIPHRYAGILFDDHCPEEYAALQQYRGVFGKGPEPFIDVLAYVKQLRAHSPARWSYDPDASTVIHGGMDQAMVIEFSIKGNPVRNGWPESWEPYEGSEMDIAQPYKVDPAKQELRRLQSIEKHLPPDTAEALRTLQCYADARGAHYDLAALITRNAPPPPEPEHDEF